MYNRVTDSGSCEMRVNGAPGLGTSELFILELLRVQPVSYLPPRQLKLAQALAGRGLLRRDGEVWFPTRSGLASLGVTVH